MNYKYCCVIDVNGKYVEFVLVHLSRDTQIVDSYTLKEGEALVDSNPPKMRMCAGAEGFISPVWDGESWVESATADEIAAWEDEHPAPEPETEPEAEPTQLDIIEAQVTYTAMMTDTLLEV